MLEVPLTVSCIIIGIAGTTYTALGGLRSVVWADCVQAVIMTGSPLVIIGKIIYDSTTSVEPPRSLNDLNITAYFLRTDMDLTTDETVWAASLAAFPFQLTRIGLDQMITQRFLAARSLPEARTVAFFGVCLVSLFYVIIGLTALAIIYWFRDCDPVLSGAMSRYDQMVPYYINQSAGAAWGIRGLFLAGVVSASISTVSSVVNSNAAVLYIDVLSPNFRIPENKSALVIVALAAGSGTIMTLSGILLPYVSSAAKFFIALYAAASGPFAGIIILAFFLPWANAKGTAVAAVGVFLVQIWQTAGRFVSKIVPASMQYSLDRCSNKSTLNGTALTLLAENGGPDVFLLYRLSPYWCCLFSMCCTVLLGLTLSLLCARPDSNVKETLRLTSPLMLKFWGKVGLIPPLNEDAVCVEVNGREGNVTTTELKPLRAEESFA